LPYRTQALTGFEYFDIWESQNQIAKCLLFAQNQQLSVFKFNLKLTYDHDLARFVVIVLSACVHYIRITMLLDCGWSRRGHKLFMYVYVWRV